MKLDLFDRLVTLMGAVTFPGYTFEIDDGEHDGAKLRSFYEDVCVERGVVERQNTRWWIVSQHATKSEIVQTMFKCILTSKEHYTREHFLYAGRPIFGPHFDVDALHDICCVKTDGRP